ncbi:MAG TPA: hypothetical protein VND64_22420 [Pirellulales bacterium]|nr:hypothetical protein [Pirellulales bacterium]
MSDRHDEQLDGLLRRWADERRPSDERLARLRNLTLRELESAKTLDRSAIAVTFTPRWRRFGAVAAMAAAVLIAFALPYVRRLPVNEDIDHGAGKTGVARTAPREASQPTSTDEVPSAAGLDPRQLASKAELVGVLRDIFPDDLVWVSESEGEIHIGLRSDTTPLDAGEAEPPAELALRIMVMARRKNQRPWTAVCSTDLVIRPQEVVAVPLDTAAGGRLAVWVCLLPDGLVAVDTDVCLDGPTGLHASSSMVQHEGVPCGTDSSEVNGWEYRVFQTVDRLPISGAAPSLAPRTKRRT